MRSVLAVALALSAAAIACSGSTKGAPTSDAAACDCRLEGSGPDAVLVMSWACYCAAYGDACAGTIVSQCVDSRQRFDYPACGLSLLRFVPAGGPIDYVFDTTGKLVGVRLASDTSDYVCPSDSSVRAFRARAGQLPAATCAEVACGACSTTSCPVADGSADQ